MLIDPTAWDMEDPHPALRQVAIALEKEAIERKTVAQLIAEAPQPIADLLCRIIDWIAEWRHQ